MWQRISARRISPVGWWTLAAVAVPVLVAAFLITFVVTGQSAPARARLTEGPSVTAPPSQATPSLMSLPARPADERDPVSSKLPVADALLRNAAVPFAVEQVGAAPQFRFGGSAIDRERAIECLALAAMAEAGGSDAGQRAVMQVVLNRVRHPAFAKTICGVVFEGAERQTGCQFTFTCDGSLSRRYSEAAWRQARQRAREALDGRTFAAVGTATHYHTDWVYPYWSPSLDKVAKIDTHLFFRWKGYWGTPPSFAARYKGQELALADLMSRANAGGSDPDRTAAITDQVVPIGRSASSGGTIPPGVVSHPEGGAYLVGYASLPSAAQALATARRLCGGNGYCRVMGWADRGAMPKGFPVPPASRARLSFSYVLDAQNNETVFYDCSQFSGIDRQACLPRSVRPT